MEAEPRLRRHADAVVRNMGQQYRASRLAWADDLDVDAARRQRRPARVILGDAAAMIVIDIDGLGAGRNARRDRLSGGGDNRESNAAHVFAPWNARNPPSRPAATASGLLTLVRAAAGTMSRATASAGKPNLELL